MIITPDDCEVYSRWLAEYAAKYYLLIWEYCLMTNHVLLVVTPDGCQSSLAMQAVQSRLRSVRMVVITAVLRSLWNNIQCGWTTAAGQISRSPA